MQRAATDINVISTLLERKLAGSCTATGKLVRKQPVFQRPDKQSSIPSF